MTSLAYGKCTDAGHNGHVFSYPAINQMYSDIGSVANYGSRPVINVKADTTVDSGDGTKNNPYTIKTKNTYKYSETLLTGADPVLDEGMIPVIIENDGTVKKANVSTKWYEYGAKQWANAVLVTNSSRNRYQTASSGTIINQEDILMNLVWIPRFEFEVWTNSLSSTEQQIKVKFQNVSSKTTSTTVGEYMTHPGFTLSDGTSELPGFWISKFQLTGTKNNLTSLPNQNIIRNTASLSDFYTAAVNVKSDKYGVTSVSRIPRGTEWMAAAYLATSTYGIGGKITPNSYLKNDATMSGCGSNTNSVQTTCINSYGSATSYNQSSTGNISGVFDLSGGDFEMTMVFKTNASGTPYIGLSTDNTGFNGPYTPSGTKTDGINLPNSKYYDTVPGHSTIDEICATKAYLGTVFCSTSNWYNAYNKYTGDQLGSPLGGVIAVMGGGANHMSITSQFQYWPEYGGTTNGSESSRLIIASK